MKTKKDPKPQKTASRLQKPITPRLKNQLVPDYHGQTTEEMSKKIPLINKRLVEFKERLIMTDVEFAGKAEISTNTFSRIKDGDRVTRATLNKIIKGHNINEEWLIDGKQVEMIKSIETSPWQQEAFLTLKAENMRLKEDNDFLKQLLLSRNDGNFPLAPANIGSKTGAKIIKIPPVKELAGKVATR